MSTSAQFQTSTTIARPFFVRMKRCLLDCLACYAAAN
ncbi:Lipoprotein [Cupriavidus oxalaticus]